MNKMLKLMKTNKIITRNIIYTNNYSFCNEKKKEENKINKTFYQMLEVNDKASIEEIK
jgi:hypothetical protein